MEPQAREEARLNQSTIEAGEGPYPTFGDAIQPPDVLRPAAASTPLTQSLSSGSKRNRTPRPTTMPEVERAGQMIDNDEAKEDVGNRSGNVDLSAGLDGDPRSAMRMWEIVQVPCMKPSSSHVPTSIVTSLPLPSPPPSPLPLPSSPTPAALPEEVVEEVLLRFPPKDPTALVRATLVCKRWRRLVSGLGFRRRFSEFHRTAPMLGMFCNREIVRVSQFVPTTAFRPHHAKRGPMVVDARHGRVFLHKKGRGLSVWDPITDEKWKVPFPPHCKGVLNCWTGAVLCSAAAGGGSCDHLDCHRGPFTVVLVASVRRGRDAVVTFIFTYSSNAAAWSRPTGSQHPCNFVNPWIRSALVGNTLYFGNMLKSSTALKYNVQLRQMSWIQLPSPSTYRCLSALTATEDGGLRFAVELEGKLYSWSTKDADEEDIRWEQNRVIDLNPLLPVDADLTKLHVVGCMDDLGTIFVTFDHAAYAIDLKSNKTKKVYKGSIDTIVPYMSFYTPALEADGRGEGPSAGGSSA